MKVNLVQSMMYVDGRRYQYEDFPDLCISCADELSFLSLHLTVTSRAVKSRVLRTYQQLELQLGYSVHVLYLAL